jgi:hypothetical protein
LRIQNKHYQQRRACETERAWASAIFLLGSRSFGRSWGNGFGQATLYAILQFLPWDGRGNGPVSPHLKLKPPDLTLLAKKNKGIYPLDDVMAAIDGRRLVRAHGDRDMPVWGEVFRSKLEGQKYPELTTLLKAKLIAEYIATLQR